jgi:ABC-type uncharacterized transport system permease subunit
VALLVVSWGVWWLFAAGTVGFQLRAVGSNPSRLADGGINIGFIYTP